ncbi:hypothetical protein NL676_036587 [Syzygium grande]|nr:hypothetical protein NL676_036587 [Syzygium grande]
MPQTPRLEKLTLAASNPALINMIFELNKLKSLEIEDTELPECLPEECLKSLTSLESLSIGGCHRLTSLSPQHLSNLVDLLIWNCKELDLCKDESGNINHDLDFHGGLQNLRSVGLGVLPKLASLPRWLLRLRNVEHLVISTCDNLKDLQDLEALQSLQRLEIVACPSLTSLPEGMRRLASLTYLGIFDCPELERRCKRDGGEDWDKIAHIPRIQLGHGASIPNFLY